MLPHALRRVETALESYHTGDISSVWSLPPFEELTGGGEAVPEMYSDPLVTCNSWTPNRWHCVLTT